MSWRDRQQQQQQQELQSDSGTDLTGLTQHGFKKSHNVLIVNFILYKPCVYAVIHKIYILIATAFILADSGDMKSGHWTNRTIWITDILVSNDL